MSTISPLPTPPSTTDPLTFDVKADAFIAALPQFVSQTNTVASEFNASNTVASTYAASAAASASTASTHATNASNSATAASNSATTAGNYATTAGTHATNAANSASTASTQATNAANSASTASTQATNAANSASTASTQATNAANSASTASTHATNAANSATTAGNHATTAGNHSTTAGIHATNAAASAASAAASANVTKWISGTSYTEGDVVWSPATLQTYRRKISGAGTTDPSADSTNWEQITVGINVRQNWTAPQRPAINTEIAPSAGVITWDLHTTTIFFLNLNASVTTFNINNLDSTMLGYQIQLVVRYNGGTSIAWNSNCKFNNGGTSPTLTGTSGKIDIFSFVVAYNGTSYILANMGNAFNI
jgi:hypothetical protein